MKNRTYSGRALEEQDAIEERQHIVVSVMQADWDTERKQIRRTILILWLLSLVGAAVLGYFVCSGQCPP